MSSKAKTLNEQLKFKESTESILFEKINVFKNLNDDDKLKKLDELFDISCKTYDETEKIRLNLRNAKHPLGILHYRKLLYSSIDKLYIYTYGLMSYMAVYHYKRLQDIRTLMPKVVKLFEQTKYLVYKTTFTFHTDINENDEDENRL